MSRRAKFYLIAIVVALASVTWTLIRLFSQPDTAPAPAVTTAPPAETAHITATLYYGSSDGRALVPVRRDVPAATSVVDQGRQILTVLFQDAPQPYVQVVPKGAKLRAFYVTERGDAFVDVSGEVVSAHPGGSLTELLTVYAIVNVVTANLPAVQRVQILVEGKEVDTLAGHVDIRRPLEQDSTLVREGRGGEANPRLKTQDSKVKK